MGSGTAGLTAALRALGIGPGDEVITVAHTDLAGSAAISGVGASVVWVDIDPESRCIDTTACEAAITPRTRALLPVDMYCHPADMIEMRRIADRRGLALVEDACLALGAEIDGRRLGSSADVTCFSFAPGKHLAAYGAAGACTTQDAALADRIRRLASDGQARGRHYGPKGILGLHHETEEHNQQMDEMQAAVLRAKLPHLDETLAVRRAQADRYTGVSPAWPICREKRQASVMLGGTTSSSLIGQMRWPLTSSRRASNAMRSIPHRCIVSRSTEGWDTLSAACPERSVRATGFSVCRWDRIWASVRSTSAPRKSAPDWPERRAETTKIHQLQASAGRCGR
ncbi:DegT/DnrJ/EryC1/StrS family aminotransferase [Streptomyces sp. DG1A-41]|uniref:DegT/DnrJ/EryC1/StrS family aminotransferase n=1 Tax=Streptomyces sp. DG1A-41 TaxID=3125779 RepID=UPI0030CB3B96